MDGGLGESGGGDVGENGFVGGGYEEVFWGGDCSVGLGGWLEELT